MILVQTDLPERSTLFDDPIPVLDDPVDRPYAAQVNRGRSHEEPEPGQPLRQRCGGGYRVIKKRIGD